ARADEHPGGGGGGGCQCAHGHLAAPGGAQAVRSGPAPPPDASRTEETMSHELGPDAQELIRRALSEEAGPSSAELDRIRRGVLGASLAAAALTASTKAAASGSWSSALLGAKLTAPIASAVAAGSLIGVAAAVASSVLGSPAPPGAEMQLVAPTPAAAGAGSRGLERGA